MDGRACREPSRAQRRRLRRTCFGDAGRRWAKPLLLGTFGVLCFAVASACSGGNGDCNDLDPTCPGTIRLTISEPADGQVVNGSQVMVRGQYAAGLTEDVWVFVWPSLAPGRGWPQVTDSTGRPAMKENERWWVQAGLGGPPQEYDIVAYTTSAAASSAIRDTFLAWARADDYPGMLRESLPVGLREEARVRISRSN